MLDDLREALMIVGSALTGATWPVGRQPTKDRTHAAFLLLKYAMTGIVLGGLVASLINEYIVKIEYPYSWACGAALVAIFCDRLQESFTKFLDYWSKK